MQTEDAKMKELMAHIAGCEVCTRANRRANDFCQTGLTFFIDWATDHDPVGAVVAEITREQYDRLVAEARRRQRSAEMN